MKKVLLLCSCIAFTLLTYSQTIDKKWNVGFHGGATQYNGDLGNGFYQTKTAFYGFGGISVSRYLGSVLDANLLVTKGEVGYTSDLGHFSSGLSTATLNLRFNILPPEVPVRPYLFLGAGVLMFATNPTLNKGLIDYSVPSFGAGINFLLAPSLMLQVQEMFHYSTNDDKDGIVAGSNDFFVMHTVGLTFNFGTKHDEDNDGVADRDDKCPGTPAGVAVDKHGCPLDRDKDGVPDYLDRCPDVFGLEFLKGCPDKDGDGIADIDDRCPDVKGTVALNGCPDTDGDGVADIDDKCPDTKAGYKVDAKGCPFDNDSDGIVNEEDRCPDQAGPASLKGCPDRDGDGVADIDDHCPDVKGTLANQGCPEVAVEVKTITVEDVKKITQIASKIFFEFNKDKLLVASLEQLDALVEILNRYPAANLTIEGHTDDVGSAEYNQTLSQKRTESVRLYLIGKGIAANRLTAIGYGKTKPIADNKTAEGRAKNRRVELKTSYGDK